MTTKTAWMGLAALTLAPALLLAQGRGHGNGGGSPGAGHGPATSPPGIARGAVDRAPDVPTPAHPEKPAKPHDLPARAAAPAARNLAGAMHSINQAAYAQRREVLGNVDLRLQSSREALKQIQGNARAARADARADFKAALEDVKTSEKELGVAAKAAGKADEASWELRRTALATAVQRHDDAMAKLEAIRFSP